MSHPYSAGCERRPYQCEQMLSLKSSPRSIRLAVYNLLTTFLHEFLFPSYLYKLSTDSTSTALPGLTKLKSSQCTGRCWDAVVRYLSFQFSCTVLTSFFIFRISFLFRMCSRVCVFWNTVVQDLADSWLHRTFSPVLLVLITCGSPRPFSYLQKLFPFSFPSRTRCRFLFI